MKPAILFRKDYSTEEECRVASKYFDIYHYRSDVPPNSLVIGRYSVMPFYQELEYDLNSKSSKLINSYKQHDYIANFINYYNDLEEFTFKTWFSLDQIPERGPFVLKGHTNSKKFEWKTHMYAENKQEAVKVYLRLQQDSLIQYQDIIIRQFVELNKVADNVSSKSCPISEEYRFFIFNNKIISQGFYWSSYADLDPNNVPREFLYSIINRIGDKSSFYVLDVARTNAGDWMLVELNDGQMSGLSNNDPEDLYSNLSLVIK